MSKSKQIQTQAKNQSVRQTDRKSRKNEMASRKDSGSFLEKLLILFFSSFLIHLVLVFLLKENQTVVIDEGLYTNIARSLAWEGKLAFRSQPVNYPYIFYPLLLVPVYWLSALLKSDVYRMIQILNTFFIASSVFPVFLFAKDFTKNTKKAYIIALIVSLMPDMLMGGYTMTECLIWPLSLWMVFFSWRFYDRRHLGDGLLTALFTGLLFFTKPGAVACGSVLLLLHFFFSIGKNRRDLLNAALSILLLIAIIAAIYGLYGLLFPSDSSLLGLYDKQTSEWGENDLLIAVEGTFLLLFLFCFACGGIWMILPLTHVKQYDQNRRHYIIALTVGVFIAVIGTAVFVVPYKWDSLGQLPLHLRYCSMYIVPFLVFALSIEIPYRKLNKAFIPLMVLFLVLSVFPGVRYGFVSRETSPIDSMSLAAFVQNNQLDGSVTGWLLTIAVIAILSFLLIALKENDGWNEKLQRFCSISFMCFVLFNAVCAHIEAGVYIDPTISEDAREVNGVIGHHESLGVMQRHYDSIYSYWLESRLNAPMQQVTMDQMFIQMEETNGVYSPFIPVEQSPNVNNHETPDTDTLVLGMTIAEHLELNQSVEAQKTKNGHFTIARIPDSGLWVDTMMYGLDNNTLYKDSVGYIHIFNENRNVNGFVHISMTASGSGTLVIGENECTLSSAPQVFEIETPYSSLISLSAKGGNADIFGYTTRSQD